MSIPLPKSIGRPATGALEVILITSLEGLSSISEKQLAALHGVGPKAVGILKRTLEENQLSLLPANEVVAQKASKKNDK